MAYDKDYQFGTVVEFIQGSFTGRSGVVVGEGSAPNKVLVYITDRGDALNYVKDYFIRPAKKTRGLELKHRVLGPHGVPYVPMFSATGANLQKRDMSEAININDIVYIPESWAAPEYEFGDVVRLRGDRCVYNSIPSAIAGSRLRGDKTIKFYGCDHNTIERTLMVLDVETTVDGKPVLRVASPLLNTFGRVSSGYIVADRDLMAAFGPLKGLWSESMKKLANGEELV